MVDIVEKLKQISDAKLGNPLPECLRRPGEDGYGAEWATPLAAEAAEVVAVVVDDATGAGVRMLGADGDHRA